MFYVILYYTDPLIRILRCNQAIPVICLTGFLNNGMQLVGQHKLYCIILYYCVVYYTIYLYEQSNHTQDAHGRCCCRFTLA